MQSLGIPGTTALGLSTSSILEFLFRDYPSPDTAPSEIWTSRAVKKGKIVLGMTWHEHEQRTDSQQLVCQGKACHHLALEFVDLARK